MPLDFSLNLWEYDRATKVNSAEAVLQAVFLMLGPLLLWQQQRLKLSLQTAVAAVPLRRLLPRKQPRQVKVAALRPMPNLRTQRSLCYNKFSMTGHLLSDGGGVVLLLP